MPDATTTARARPRATVLAPVVVVALLVVVIAALWWRGQGGRWYAVETPSMGEALPVGSLLLTSSVEVADVEVGDVVTFRAPRSGTTYTHRVVELVGGERLVTRGDVNDAADAGTIGQEHLVGRVVWHAGGLGWVLRATPLAVAGGVLSWLLGLLVARRRRRGVHVVGLSLTLAATNLLLHPWVGLQRLSQRDPVDGSPGVLVDVVSIGLLPLRAEQVDGGAVARLGTGEVATMHLDPQRDGAYQLVAVADLGGWGWALVLAACLAPLAVSLALALRSEHEGATP